jgi:hypothetical protein
VARKAISLVVVLALAVVGVVVWNRRSRHTSTASDLGAPAAPRPSAYRILYRVEALASPPFATRWEELTVRRPFESRQISYDERPTGPDAPGGSGTLATIDHLYVVGADRGPAGLQEVSGRQPGVPTGDEALSAEVTEAVRRGLARPAGDRTVAGRTCHDYRFLEPVAGPIKALTGADHDLICLDGLGLVLREEWVLDGRIVQRKEAVEVTIDPSSVDRAFDAAGALPSPGSASPQVLPRLAPDASFPDPPAPAGFRLVTVVGFQLPAPQQLGSGPADLLYSSTVWAFARGGDVVTVELGTSTQAALPWSETDPSRSLSLSLGRATSVLRSDGPEIRVDLGRRRWVRVRGTVGPAQLSTYAQRLSVR